MLLSIGKENLHVWEKRPGILHEDEAAALLYKAAAGKNIHGTEPKEGKIELIATVTACSRSTAPPCWL